MYLEAEIEYVEPHVDDVQEVTDFRLVYQWSLLLFICPAKKWWASGLAHAYWMFKLDAYLLSLPEPPLRQLVPLCEYNIPTVTGYPRPRGYTGLFKDVTAYYCDILMGLKC